MYKLIVLLRALNQFRREAKSFLDESDRLIEQHDPYDAFVLGQCCGRIIFLAYLFPIVLGLIVPIATPWVAYHNDTFKSMNAPVTAMIFSLILSPLTSFFYLFSGVALGCLLAPPEFWDSPVGEKWLDLIGTRNLAAAKAVCLALVLAGLVGAVGLAIAQVSFMYQKDVNI